MAALLVQGAAVTSVGMALATWIRRLGRGVAVSVTSYAFFAFGWVLCLEIIPEILSGLGLISPDDSDAAIFLVMVIASACPFGGQLVLLETMNLAPSESRAAFYIGQIIVILAILVFALVVLGLTLATFDRCMGRGSGAAPASAATTPPRGVGSSGARPGHAGRPATARPVPVDHPVANTRRSRRALAQGLCQDCLWAYPPNRTRQDRMSRTIRMSPCAGGSSMPSPQTSPRSRSLPGLRNLAPELIEGRPALHPTRRWDPL